MSLKLTAFSAGRWTATSAVLVACVQLVQTMVLARLLLPQEFGLMAVAAAVLVVLTLFADLGLSRALIHFDHVPANVLASLYWLNLGVSLFLMLALSFSAPMLGTLYQSSGLVPVLQVASLVFPISALGQQFRVLAEKELRFASLAVNEIAAALIGFCAAIMVAVAGGGVYALVAGMLTGALVSSVLAWWRLSRGYRPSWHFSLSEARPYLRFGGYSVGDGLAGTLHRQSDVFIGGLVVGPGALGVYSLPRDLSLRLSMLVNPIITRVGFPVMSRLKNDRDRLKVIYLHTSRMTASVSFPCYMVLGLFSNEIVSLLYGDRWQDAAAYLRILAAWGLVRSVLNPVGSLLYASGRADRAFWWNMTMLLLFPPLLWLGARWGGLAGLAWTMLALQCVVLVPSWRYLVYPACHAGLGEYLRTILVPLWLTLLAGSLAWFVTMPIAHGVMRLLLGGVCGAIAYIGLSLRFNRDWTDAMRELLHLPPRPRRV
jgi:O-antigen/teichoic acid export membrane protein